MFELENSAGGDDVALRSGLNAADRRHRRLAGGGRLARDVGLRPDDDRCGEHHRVGGGLRPWNRSVIGEMSSVVRTRFSSSITSSRCRGVGRARREIFSCCVVDPISLRVHTEVGALVSFR